MRISASRSHRIKTRRNNFDALAIQLSEEQDPYGQGALNVQYGFENECTARNVYKRHSDGNINRCGLLIHPVQNWLCASPDAVVLWTPPRTSIRVLEIKCSISCEERPIINHFDEINVKYIDRSNDGSLFLKKSHEYYTQCQILMYCAAAGDCDLFIYSEFDNHTIRANRDEEFLSRCIPKLERFYYTAYLPLLIEKHGLHENLN